MKRFLIFVFDTFEAHGGATDCVDSFDTLAEALTSAPACENLHVLDADDREWHEFVRRDEKWVTLDDDHGLRTPVTQL